MTPPEWAVHFDADRVAKMNAQITEVQGYLESLRNGEIPIQGLGNSNAQGPDWITYEPSSQTVFVWDAKYRAPGGRYPSQIDPDTMEKWKSEIADAIACMPEGDAKEGAAKAFADGRIRGRIFRGPSTATSPVPSTPPPPAPETPKP
jgi:filamentous hemagglutinin